MAEQQDSLPPGWDCKYDTRTGRYYFINYFTKSTTWEDPRIRYRQLQGTPTRVNNVQSEYIPLQHGSPDLRRNYVYPSQTSPIPAFQMPSHCSPKTVPLQEMNVSRMSPMLVKGVRIQDSSLTVMSDSDNSVTKIRSMFPTASDTHIRLLLKKYHNREAVVISALQVEKHPITTPGPFATPPPTRNFHVHAPLQMTPPLGFRSLSRSGSPVTRPGSVGSGTYGDGFRNSPRPHSSPKLKLRYMKSIFPGAEETIILDVLSSNDNNIQKSSDALKEMGFEKKDTLKISQQADHSKAESDRKAIEEEKLATPPPRMKSVVEKAKLRADLQEKYKDVPEQVVFIALESVNFDEERANQILQALVQEQIDSKKRSENEAKAEELKREEASEVAGSDVGTVPASQSRQSLKSLLKSEKDSKDKTCFTRVVEEANLGDAIFKSSYLGNTYGANRTLVKGANEDLLIEDYVKWQGPNLTLRQGAKQGLAKGPNANLLLARSYQPRGPNSDLRKGPKFGLARGSIFSQLKGSIVGESRGK